MVHSGLQFGGIPIYVGKQEQDGDPPLLRHCELGPQGLGMHGSIGACWTGGGNGAANYRYVYENLWIQRLIRVSAYDNPMLVLWNFS